MKLKNASVEDIIFNTQKSTSRSRFKNYKAIKNNLMFDFKRIKTKIGLR